MIIKYVYLALLAVVSIIHLVDSWNDDSKKRARTKGFLLPLIILYYISAADNISWFLLAALITSWLGDVLLIPKGNKWFAAGGISFLLAHLLFIATYAFQINLGGVIWYIVIPAALIYFFTAGIVIKKLLPFTPKKMVIPMFAYLIANSAMNVFALMQLVSNFSTGSIIAFAGAVLFFVSDCTLFMVRFHEKTDIIFKRHFTVMLSYILGELLITQGIIMLTK